MVSQNTEIINSFIIITKAEYKTLLLKIMGGCVFNAKICYIILIIFNKELPLKKSDTRKV